MICRGCGGVLGRDCFNQADCEWISRDMEARAYSEPLQQEVEELRNKLEYVYRNILFGFEYKTFDFTVLYKEALAWKEAQPSRDSGTI